MSQQRDLRPNQKEFIKEFVKTGNLDAAAEKAGMCPNAVVKSLSNNVSGFSDRLKQAIHRQAVAASYYDPNVVLNSLYVMATDDDTKADSRVRAAKIWLDNNNGVKDTGNNEDKFDEILQVVGKKDE